MKAHVTDVRIAPPHILYIYIHVRGQTQKRIKSWIQRKTNVKKKPQTSVNKLRCVIRRARELEYHREKSGGRFRSRATLSIIIVTARSEYRLKLTDNIVPRCRVCNP